MRSAAIILFLIMGLRLFSQTSSSGHPSVDGYYGYRVLFQDFYGHLNTVKKAAWNNPLQVIGIGLSEQVAISRNKGAYINIVYSQVIPRAFSINDSLKGKITGFVLAVSLGKYLATKSGVLSLYYYAGFNTGRLRLYDNPMLRQKNPFFSPKIGLRPQLSFGKLEISLLLEYDYDISKTGWKSTRFASGAKADVANLRQTALTAQLGLGYSFH